MVICKIMLTCWLMLATLSATLNGQSIPDENAPSPTPMSDHQIITKENANQLAQLGTIGQGMIGVAVLSPDDEILAVPGSIGVRLYQMSDLSKQPHLLQTPDTTYQVAFSPDSQILAASTDTGHVYTWHLDTEQETTLQAGTGVIGQIIFSPVGKQLLLSQGHSQFQLCDATTNTFHSTFAGNQETTTVVFSPDGQLVALSGLSNDVEIWNAQTGLEQVTLTGHTDYALAAAFSPYGIQIATGGRDRTIRFWDVATGKSTKVWHIGDRNAPEIDELVYSPNGKMLASYEVYVGGGATRLWDLATGNERSVIRTQQGMRTGCKPKFSSDSKMITVCGPSGTSEVIQVSTGEPMRIFPDHFSYDDTLLFTSDGQRLVTQGDQAIHVWNLQRGTRIGTIDGFSSLSLGLAFKPTGKVLASVGFESFVKLWDVNTGTKLGELPLTKAPVALAVSYADALLAVSYADGTTDLWNISTKEHQSLGSHIPSDFPFPSDSYNAEILDMGQRIAFNPDGELLAVGRRDHIIQLWDVATGMELKILEGHTDSVTSVVFSPDGKWLASAGWDGTIRLWGIP